MAQITRGVGGYSAGEGTKRSAKMGDEFRGARTERDGHKGTRNHPPLERALKKHGADATKKGWPALEDEGHPRILGRARALDV